MRVRIDGRMLALTSWLVAACGGSSTPTGPTPSPVTTSFDFNPSSASASLGMRVMTSPSQRARPAVVYVACGTATVIGPLTYRAAVDLLDSAGTAYGSTNFWLPGTIDPGMLVGCGVASAVDFSFAHPVARRFRMRVSYWRTGESESTARMTQFESPVSEPVPVLPQQLVIEEFRTRGPNGPSDQFVELFNDSLSPAVVSGFVDGFDSRGERRGMLIQRTTIGPFCHFLVTAPGYSGRTRGDASLPTPVLADDGDVRFNPTFINQYVIPDLVGMNSRSYEGTPLPPFGSNNTDRSYARRGPDTDDNLNDFVMIAPSEPQNSSSCGARPFGVSLQAPRPFGFVRTRSQGER